MKLKTLFIINTIVAGLFGLGFLFVPNQVTAPYGVTLNEAGIGIIRLLGAAFIGFALIAWFARDAAASEARRAIVLSYFIAFVIDTLVSLQGQLTGTFNALGWSTVVISALFALSYGYFQFMKPEAA